MTPYEGPLGESVKEISLWTGRNCRQNQTFLGWGEDHTVSERNPSNYTIPYEQPLDNNEKKKAILIWRNLSFANHLPALFNVLEDINTGKLNLSEEGWGLLLLWCLKSDVYTVAVGVMYRSVFVCVILTRKRWTTESRKGRAGFLI